MEASLKSPKLSGAVECFIWEDSYTRDGWAAPEEVSLDGCKIITVGFASKEDECFVAVSPSRTECGDVCSTIIIPKINLLHRKKLVTADAISEILCKQTAMDF